MKVLIIGAGPIVIGQSAEFDYAGTQALSILREMGAYTVLLNSNPATIQTDETSANHIYILPINAVNAKRIIEEEKITHIIGTMGGQTALNLLLELHDSGFLQEHNVKVLGSTPDAIRTAEDRTIFHRLMESIGLKVPWSVTLHKDSWEDDMKLISSFPAIMRTSFTLGGLSGTMLKDSVQAGHVLSGIFESGKTDEVEIEQSLEGMTEMEYEIIRDGAGNAIMVCNMENLDPMGVHTGESIVVTPSLTIPDFIHQKMRKAALFIAESIGIIGACNVQFSIDADRETFYVIEVNPRTSRSSALASKASGYPIAKVATMILMGMNLPEIRNPITSNSSAAFEPSMDYVIVKIPLWPSDKFTDTGIIGVSMKSTGEVMGIGRSFEEAFLKAVVATEIDFSKIFRNNMPEKILLQKISTPNWTRLGSLMQAMNQQIDHRKISAHINWNDVIIQRLQEVFRFLNECSQTVEDHILALKEMGVPDRVIAWKTGISELNILKMRKKLGIISVSRIIDSSSAEFSSKTRYMYSTYEEENEVGQPVNNAILILGSGPNRIGQGLEFDYSTVKAIQALKEKGRYAIIINSNPETVSTDFNVSDELYFDPLTLEYVSGVIEQRKPDRIIIQFSGQTGQNMAMDIASVYGEHLIAGTSASNLQIIENRHDFSRHMDQIQVEQPQWFNATNMEEMMESCQKLDYSVIMRGSFIIGGTSMIIIESKEAFASFVKKLKERDHIFPILISKYLKNARELDLDFISDGHSILPIGIMEQIEHAGIHSGDSLAVMGPGIPCAEERKVILSIAEKLCRSYNLTGFSNIQFMIHDDKISVIELNARASRTVPVLSKWSRINWIKYGIEAILEGALPEDVPETTVFGAKIPVFPYNRFQESGFELSPQMHSTGEGMVTGDSMEELKASVREFMSLVYRNTLTFTHNSAHFKDDHGIREMTLEEGIAMLKLGGNFTVVCSNESPARLEVSRICLSKKLDFIPDVELAEFLDVAI
jgi:Carbamoylphosphate synthase large subunit (split gene in MJ)